MMNLPNPDFIFVYSCVLFLDCLLFVWKCVHKKWKKAFPIILEQTDSNTYWKRFENLQETIPKLLGSDSKLFRKRFQHF